MPIIERYGLHWPAGTSEHWIELGAIRQGGCGGKSLFHHYKRFAQLVWPGDWWSRWDDLILDETIRPGTIGVAGPSSSGKSHRLACTALTSYWAFPNETTILCSTTTIPMLEMRIFGEIKKYFRLAMEIDPTLPGHLIDSKYRIVTDSRDEDVRDFRSGILGVAVQKGSRFEGLSNLVGLKHERVMLIADESMLMPPGFFDATANLAANPWFLLAALGNPNDTGNAFGQICEPKDGWESVQQGIKTQIWETRYGRCLNLVGTDSPNLDFPEDKEPYRRLIGRRYISKIAREYGTEHWKYLSWVLAMFPSGVLERRVITRAMCVKFHAFEPAIWNSGKIIKIFGLDAAYGAVGGDRCIGGELWFGRDVHGRHQLEFQGQPILIPVDNRKPMLPEDQIVIFVKDYCSARSIPPENVIFDSTGRGTLGTAFARLWSSAVIPLEFGGSATDRPVRDGSPQTCKQAYGKFVTELWYSWRLVVESDQFRGLPESIMIEGQMRTWSQTGTNKVDVEKKEDTRERLGRSPDCFVAGTLISTPSGDVAIEFMKPGDEVLTPFGITQVGIVHEVKTDELTSVLFSNGALLTGKGNHRVFTWDSGWVRLSDLSIANRSESVHNLPQWNLLNLLFTRDENIAFKQLVDIIKTKTGASVARDFYTGLSGKRTMDLFLKGCASIIKMVTGQITISKIWHWLQWKNIPAIILKSAGNDQSPESNSWRLVLKFWQRQLCGTSLMTESIGTGKTLSEFGKSVSNSKRIVVPAGRSSCHSSQLGSCATVRSLAETRPAITVTSALRAFAWCVANNLLRTSTARGAIAPVIVRQLPQPESRKVYNLTLIQENVYYANGILVENCADMLVAAVEGARRKGFRIEKLSNPEHRKKAEDWLSNLRRKYKEVSKSKQLEFT